MGKINRLLVSAGAMKAGTSWLYSQLEQHSFIETVPVKEIHYFAHQHTPLKFLSAEGRIHNFKMYASACDYKRTLRQNVSDLQFFQSYLSEPIDDRWYRSLFRSKRSCFKADFSNMAAVLSEDALLHIKRSARKVRLIYTLRDPLFRLWSHVKFHASTMGELERIDNFDVSDYLEYFSACGADKHSDYAANLKRMIKVFGSDGVHVLMFETMMSDAERSLNGVWKFLGLPVCYIPDSNLKEMFNVGPDRSRPAAFTEAARQLLSPQFSALQSLGVTFPSSWNSTPELWA